MAGRQAGRRQGRAHKNVPGKIDRTDGGSLSLCPCPQLICSQGGEKAEVSSSSSLPLFSSGVVRPKE